MASPVAATASSVRASCGVVAPGGSAGCRGALVPGHARCLAHVRAADRAVYLAGLSPGAAVDHRATEFSQALLAELLAGLRDHATGTVAFGDARFGGADFSEDAGFDGVVFLGDADFDGARFHQEAAFEGALFRGDALFREVAFAGVAAFDDAVFSGIARFDDARVGGDAWFRTAVFADAARFDDTRFLGDAWFDDSSFADTVRFLAADFATQVRFDGTRFSGTALFDGARFGGNATFHQVSFAGDTWFRGAEFVGMAGFDGAAFTAEAGFDAVVFRGVAAFDDASFACRAGFRGATFESEGWFTRAAFADYSYFTGASFAGNTWFDGATFARGAVFDDAEFSGIAGYAEAAFAADAAFVGVRFSGEVWFHGTLFRGDAGFERAWFASTSRLGALVCEQTLVLSRAVFAAPVTIEAVARAVACVRTRWDSTATLRLRYADVDLSDAVLSLPVAVTAHPAPLTDEAGQPVPEPGWTRAPGIRVVSLRGVDAAHLVLTDTDLTTCRFSGAFHLDQLHLEGETLFATPPSGRRRRYGVPIRLARRRTLAEEHHWRALAPDNPPPPRGWTPAVAGPPNPARSPRPSDIAPIYRALRKASEDAKNEPDAADFYYGEMEMRRRDRARPAGERALLTTYWLVSGYGLRATRALGWLLLAMVATVLAMMLWGLPTKSTEPHTVGVQAAPGERVDLVTDNRAPELTGRMTDRFTGQRAEKAARVVVNSVVFRSSGQDLTTVGTYVEMVSRFTEPVLLALATLAVRSRVKR